MTREWKGKKNPALMRNPIIQPHQEGNQRLPGMDAALYVRPKSWGDLDHFKERLDFLCTQET